MTTQTTRLLDLLSQHDHYQANAIAVREAQRIIQEFVTPITETENVSLLDAFDRVLARDVISPIDVPAHDNSAMDGFAFCGKVLDSTAIIKLTIAGKAFAGHPFPGTVNADQCVSIMTGATMPENCDTVIPVEHVDELNHEMIQFATNKLRPGDNRRCRGEDIDKNKIALPAGTLIGAAELGLLASLGITNIDVTRRIKVAFFSTGDELRSLGAALDEGCVYDSNRYTVFGMLKRLNCELIDLGVVADNPTALEATLRLACQQADVIITSAGVSVGAADYTKQVLAKLGEVEFWTLAMQPGRHMAFGQIHSSEHSAYLFGLPGNPVAVMVTFYFFARQALQHMMGMQVASDRLSPKLVPALSQQAIRKRLGRTEYQRGIVSYNGEGKLQVRLTGSQGSGILRSMVEANCIIVLNEQQANIGVGEQVDILLFDGLR